MVLIPPLWRPRYCYYDNGKGRRNPISNLHKIKAIEKSKIELNRHIGMLMINLVFQLSRCYLMWLFSAAHERYCRRSERETSCTMVGGVLCWQHCQHSFESLPWQGKNLMAFQDGLANDPYNADEKIISFLFGYDVDQFWTPIYPRGSYVIIPVHPSVR